MKTLVSIATLIVMVFTLASPAFATTVSAPAINVTASVDTNITLSVSLVKESSPTTSIGSIAFGQLQVTTNTSTGGQTLRSSDTGTGALLGGAIAFVSANSHGAHYAISETGTALTNGVNTIPTGACVMNLVYATQDNGGAAIPTGAALGLPVKGSWVGTRQVYNSEASNTAIRTVQAHFAITDDPNAGATAAVPLNQAGGNYANSTITFTVVSP